MIVVDANEHILIYSQKKVDKMRINIDWLKEKDFDDAHLEALEKDGLHQASREAQKKRAQKCLNCDDIGAFTKSVKCQQCGAWAH